MISLAMLVADDDDDGMPSNLKTSMTTFAYVKRINVTSSADTTVNA